ncbi:MAG: hypothetical protein LBG78_04245 [Azoarcus sp.]|jgi:hypothetical protein|nr:hypothetical protein [Azoarcus sp.]
MFSRIFLVLAFVPALAAAQDSPSAPPPSAPAESAALPSDVSPKPEPPKAEKNGRDTSGYRFPAITTTVAAAQNMAYAMILRDYCADKKIPDDFVSGQLARFGKITGREETCRSLLDY